MVLIGRKLYDENLFSYNFLPILPISTLIPFTDVRIGYVTFTEIPCINSYKNSY